MATLETKSNCQSNDLNNYQMEVEASLRFPLDSSMQIIFTGYYNGFGVEIRSIDEMTLLYHMGCFGKGSLSRSKPKGQILPTILRKRQFHKRNHWCRKYKNSQEKIDSDIFLSDIDKLAAKIISEGDRELQKDVIDLVSSEENSVEDNDGADTSLPYKYFHNYDKEDLVVIVSNSDSEGDDYFLNMKPKCCINKIKLPEKLMLTSQESFFLLYGLGCLQIINFDNTVLGIEQCWEMFTKSDNHFIEKYVVYHYFRSKGYIVKPGIKFGGDYLLYKEGPGVNHAELIVLIRYSQEQFDWISILGQVRVSSSTVKEILVAEVVKKSERISKMPQDLSDYSVREILLSRTIPVTINNEVE